MKDKKILISGGGIAGFTLAYWLKKRGFSPTIIEKHPSSRKGGYKVDIRGAALDVVQRMDIYQDLLDANVNLLSSKLVTPDEKVFEFDGDILGHSLEGEIEINRWDLALILSKKIDGIEIIYGESITNIDKKMVYFEKMEPKEFDIIVGADGQYSNVRRLVFGEDNKFLKSYGIEFCVFPIPNIFELKRSEIVYFHNKKLAAAYCVNNHSYACLAFSSKKIIPPINDFKDLFEKQFQALKWKIPDLISFMKQSDECYFNSIGQVRMDHWSLEEVVLVGDAAYSAQGMGTSLAIIGAYILAREIEKSNNDSPLAFFNYQQCMEKFVNDAQNLAEENQKIFKQSLLRAKFQFFLLKIIPKKLIQYLSFKAKMKMKKVADSLILEPLSKEKKYF